MPWYRLLVPEPRAPNSITITSKPDITRSRATRTVVLATARRLGQRDRIAALPAAGFTVRLFVMFAAPPEQSLEWSDSGIEGAHRFLKRLWKFARGNYRNSPPADTKTYTREQRAARRKIHQTIIKVNDDIGRRYTFNTAIAAVMELLNVLNRMSEQSDNARGNPASDFRAQVSRCTELQESPAFHLTRHSSQ